MVVGNRREGTPEPEFLQENAETKVAFVSVVI